jgi:hypothetical protein
VGLLVGSDGEKGLGGGARTVGPIEREHEEVRLVSQ